MEANQSATLRVHINFKKRVMEFIEEFKKVNGISISRVQATKIIDDKIDRKGGLKV